jgi:hypothetical protein
MKVKAASSLARQWPHGVTVEISAEGFLLKPKPKPRQTWTTAFKQKGASDELKSLRGLQNHFDKEEWEW